MIEGEAKELPEAEFVTALAFAHDQVAHLIRAQKELAAAAGKPKRQATLFVVPDELLEIAYRVAGDRIEAALYTPSKVARQKAVEALKEEVSAAILEAFPEATKFEISQAFDYLQKKAFRISILDKKIRCDGRGYDEIRPLSAETGLLPRSHGSALFQRGETQALCLATLAPADEAQELDGYTGGETSKRFILHYNFPPFSVGETGRTGGPGRREIGHGALAERSIAPVVPEVYGFPIRHPRQQRDHGIKRFDLDGQRLRGCSRPDGRRRSHQQTRRGNQLRTRHRIQRRHNFALHAAH